MTELIIDTKPYCPDIFFDNNKSNINEKINQQKTLNASRNIFIVNANDPNGIGGVDSVYNNIEYMLYGNPSSYSGSYYPSYYFFKFNDIDHIKLLYETQTLSSGLISLLKSIGYVIYQGDGTLNVTEFSYKEIKIYDSVSQQYRDIIFIYFIYTTDDTTTYYNLYKDTIYYKNVNWNIMIYPFITSSIPTANTFEYFFSFNFYFNSDNLIQLIDFDDRENISFIKKIDFKYFENKNLCQSKAILMNGYANYMKNNKMFLKKYFDKKSLLISLNEIGKTNDQNSIDSDNINKHYVNKYNTYSLVSNKYLMSFDSKISYSNTIKNKNINNYNPFYYELGTNNSLYEINKNYQINGFIDLNTSSIKIIQEMTIINQYLRQIYLLINPYILDSTYFNDYTFFTITSIKNNQNEITINNSIDSSRGLLNYPLSINPTKTFYLNYYEINFSFYDYSSTSKTNDNLFTFTIILKILYYNSTHVTIQNLTKTKTSDDLAFISFQEMNKEYSMEPCLSNYSDNKIFENPNLLKFNDVKYYNFMLNYDNESRYKYNENINLFYNFYFSIPNIINITNVNGIYDINIQKINNFIQNILNINNNFTFLNFKLLKKFLLLSIVYDNLITNDLVYITSIPQYNLTLSEKKQTNLVIVPSGNYVIFNYVNMYPEKILVSGNDDSYVEEVDTIQDFLQNNFSLLIKIPDSYEINSIKTKFYLVCNTNDGLYLTSAGYYLGLELFNYTYSKINLKFILNIFYGNYMNMNTLNIIIPFYHDYTEENTQIIDIDNTLFKLHNNEKMDKILIYDYDRFLKKKPTSQSYNTYMSYNTNNNPPQEYTINDSVSKDLLLTDYNKYYISNQLFIFNTQVDFSHIFYTRKLEEYGLELNYKRLFFVFNTKKIIDLLNNCYYYLSLIKQSMLLGKQGNFEYYLFIICNAKKIIKFTKYNYELNITYSTTESDIICIFEELCDIDKNPNIENINTLMNDTVNATIYEDTKKAIVEDEIIKYTKKIRNEHHVYYSDDFFIKIANVFDSIILKLNSNFYKLMKKNVDNFIDLISSASLLNSGYVNINEDDLYFTQSYISKKINNVTDIALCVLKENSKIEKCEGNYSEIMSNYLRHYLNLLYVVKIKIPNDSSLNDYINRFIDLFKNKASSLLENVINILIELLEKVTKYSTLSSNIEESGYDFSSSSYEDVKEFSVVICEILNSIGLLMNNLELVRSVISNDSFSDFVTYIYCMFIEAREYTVFAIMRYEILNSMSEETDNQIIQLFQQYSQEFLSIVVFYSITNKSIYEYQKDKSVNLKLLITNVINTINVDGNNQIQTVIDNIKTDFDTKIDSFVNLVKSGDIPTDYLVKYEVINSQYSLFKVYSTLEQIKFLEEAINAVSASNDNIYNNFIANGNDSHNGNIINILNYKYISNPYVNLNITNTNVFV